MQDKELQQTIATYRDKYRTAPIGHWSQAVGTFNVMMDEYWEFNTDHTGKVTYTGPFRAVTSELQFVWREVANLTIACREIHQVWFDREKEDNEEEQEIDEVLPEEEYWVTIRYDFTRASTDTGDVVSMCEVLEDGTGTETFWLSDSLLMPTDFLRSPPDAMTAAPDKLQDGSRKVETNSRAEKTQFSIGIPRLCTIWGTLCLTVYLVKLKGIIPEYLIIGVILLPLLILFLTDLGPALPPNWQRFSAKIRPIAATSYLIFVVVVVLLIIFGHRIHGWKFIILMVTIGCYEPVMILKRCLNQDDTD